MRVWRAAPGGGRAVLLDGVDWRVAEGERWALLGPNGAGKTTLLRIAGAVAHPSEGTAAVLGTRLGRADLRELRARIGHVDARMAERFPTRVTALQVALTGAAGTTLPPRGDGGEPARRRARELLDAMGCGPVAGRPFALLSAGERQRVLLARALMPRPRLLLLDEPTAGVDPKARRDFWDEVHALAARGITVLLTTHYMDEAERCDRLAYLAYGNLLTRGTAAEVIAAARLSTWTVTGPALRDLAEKLRGRPGIEQVVAFGNSLHVSGRDAAQLAAAIASVREAAHTWRRGDAGLEDVFISLMDTARDNFA